ncbi:MAG: GTPase Era [Candidatus Tyloplasma litorale]|nr:MAG: GTPase Era [Mycoplasmatales bacterium]
MNIENDKKIKSGFVSIVGKPNSGKSTLLNCIIGHKISIATHKKNTTRNQIKGILNSEDAQIIFMDTPGFIDVKTKLDEDMYQRIIDSIKGVDIILYLLPFWKDLDNEYLETIKITEKTAAKKYLLLTKVDKAKTKTELLEIAKKFNETNLFDKIIPISSYRETNIKVLVEEIKKDLKEDVAYYDRDSFHEFSDQFYSAEIIREKALFNLNNEIPHHLFVSIEEFENKKRSVFIRAEIIIDRDNLKRIIIGKNGSKIKIIGEKSREELEHYFGKKVFLETFVKIKKDWKNKDSIIKNI